MAFASSIEKLEAFKLADKYESFEEIQPGIRFSAEDQKRAVSKILNDCSSLLIKLFSTEKRPAKAALKNIIAVSMDEITRAAIDAANKDFAYELCWYLSDISGIKLKLASERKTWGYWKVSGSEVKTVLKNKATLNSTK